MLQFIGTGSAFNTRLGNTSAFLRQSGHMLLLDCGGSVFDRILRAELLEGVGALDICLTHTHGDHVGSLGDLVFYCHYILGIVPTLRHPDALRIRMLLTLLGVPEALYRMEEGVEFQLPGWLTGRFIPQAHVDTLAAYGLLINLPGNAFWYSGDSKDIPQEILDRLLRGDLNCLYQDTSGLEYPDMLHLSINRLQMLIPEPYRHRVVCIHLDEAFDEARALALGFRTAVPVGGLDVRQSNHKG